MRVVYSKFLWVWGGGNKVATLKQSGKSGKSGKSGNFSKIYLEKMQKNN